MSAHGSIKKINKFSIIIIYKYFFCCIPLIFFFILLLLILLVSPGIKIIAVKAYLANGNRGSSNKEPSPCFTSIYLMFLRGLPLLYYIVKITVPVILLLSFFYLQKTYYFALEADILLSFLASISTTYFSFEISKSSKILFAFFSSFSEKNKITFIDLSVSCAFLYIST